YRRGSRDRS
ncbi:DNA topoisomerase 4 subunit B, partial [Haemophilus influenzae]